MIDHAGPPRVAFCAGPKRLLPFVWGAQVGRPGGHEFYSSAAPYGVGISNDCFNVCYALLFGAVAVNGNQQPYKNWQVMFSLLMAC